jgi:type VI secretion system protein ImpH
LAHLHERPYEFDFYQALRRLEAAYPEKPRLGTSLRPQDDPVRLAQEPTLAFAPATLAAFQPGGDEQPARLVVQFAGLFGPNGPLPLHLTEYARDRLRNSGDPTFARFVDLFHHRMLSLFYRAWAAAQPAAQFDRPESDRFAAYVGSLAGIGLPSLAGRDAMPDLAKLHFAGRLVCHARHAEGLEALLGEFFQLPMQLLEFVGQWLAVPDDCHCVLASGPAAAQAPTSAAPPAAEGLTLAALGISATIGERVWDCQQKFRIVAGPLGLADYHRLLPGGESLQRLLAVVANYVGYELEWDLHLLLRQAEVPQAELGRLGQLGWTTWLLSGAAAKDADDLVLRPQAA